MKYSASPKILLCDDDAQLAWDAIRPIWDDLPLSPYNRLCSFLDELTSGQRGLIALDWCQKEIRNGGIRQLFENSTGNLVPWAIAGFHLIGADKYEAIFIEAAGMFGSDYPISGHARKKVYRALNGPQRSRLDELETKFLLLLTPGEEDLEAYRGSYVRKHPDEFIESKAS